MLLWKDDGRNFGAISVALHAITALFVITLLVLGFWAWLLDRSPVRSALLHTHVSIGLTLMPIFLIRVAWRLRQGKRAVEYANPWLRRLADAVWRLLLVLIAMQLLSGPFLVWLHGRPMSYFGWIEIASPIAKDDRLHATLMQPLHLATGLLLAAALALHVLGAFKHLLIDRDGVTEGMFRFVRNEAANGPAQAASQKEMA